MENTLTHMVKCIRYSKDPEPDIEAGLLQVKMVHAIKESARTGQLLDIREL